MRRSARRSAAASHDRKRGGASSPSATEVTVTLATPSVSPTPDGLHKHYATPGRRDDGTPKRPMNAFILFSNEKRSELADLNPHLCARPE